MPEIQHTMCFTTDQPGSVYNVSFSIKDGLQQFWVIRRVILQVGILDQNDVSRARSKTGTQRCALATIMFMKQQTYFPSLTGRDFLQPLTRSIRRKVVDYDQFLLNW